MPDETVETYTNIYARWFAIISQFIVTASLCTLWRLQMTRYSQVLVHSTVVNSRLSHQYMSISLIFLSCFGIYSDFSYFLPGHCLPPRFLCCTVCHFSVSRRILLRLFLLLLGKKQLWRSILFQDFVDF